MTTSAAESLLGDKTRARIPGPRLRAVTWALHVTVVTLAVVSIVTNNFAMWIDLRMFGAAGTLIEILWVGTTVLVPFCAGPHLHGWLSNPRWKHAGFTPNWAWWLLWPTYALLACLLANSVYYVVLRWQNLADLMIPLPLVVAILLASWVLLTRHWLRSLPQLPTVARAARTTCLRATLFALPVIVLMVAAFLLPLYSRPPSGKVDLAVVLGTAVRRDGRPSVELTQRTQVAIDLYQRGMVKHILLSGAKYTAEETHTIAQNEVAAMKQVCVEAGIPEEAISLDPVGFNTKATAFNTRNFMRTSGYQTVVVCSSDYHLYRTVNCFQEAGIHAHSLPARKDDWQCPNPLSISRELVALVVYEAFPHYREPKALTMQLAAPRLIVRKAANTLELFDGSALVKTYPCITGGNAGDKAREGDRKTPVGSFHIVFKNPESKFHLSLGLDYPNRDNADRGLAAGLITQAQYQGVLEALQSDLSRVENQQKLWYTPLGGEIFLHGHADGRTGTAGCIALSNPDIEELYAILPVGTPVEIQP